MNVTEIILLILGLLVFILSFVLPAKKKGNAQEPQQLKEEQIKELISREVEDAKRQITDIVDETVTYSMEKTERAMDRLTNEKMMAVNEYSDTVLGQIEKNHKEVVFLYDMLNDKHENLKTTVSEAVKTATEVKQTVKDAEITAREAKETALEVQESLMVAEEMNYVPAEEAEFAVAEEVFEAESVAETFAAEETMAMPEQSQIPEEPQEFVPINPLKVTVLHSPSEETAAEAVTEAVEPKPAVKRTARKPKAEKTDLSLTAPGRVGKQNNNERILELHNAGKSNMAIAKELGLGIGEVKLVIDLFEGI
ncbi:MAG: hypothetical protein IKY23_07810 [Lachnospiraceae bacterium]|nr:hypothetical protein [Lachnospiraceae bacterium]